MSVLGGAVQAYADAYLREIDEHEEKEAALEAGEDAEKRTCLDSAFISGIETSDKELLKILSKYRQNARHLKPVYSSARSVVVNVGHLQKMVELATADKDCLIEVFAEEGLPLKLRLLGRNTSLFLAGMEGPEVEEKRLL